MIFNWSRTLIGQLEFYWDAHLRPRLDGLTDEEYFWEPAEECWSLRPADGGRRMDGPAERRRSGPLTTIAWRMTHISVECLESRYRAFFGGEGPNQWSPGERILESGDLPGGAAEAVTYLEEAYARWRDGVAGLSGEQLLAPLGAKGADFAEFPMAELVIHINREVMHHGAEVCLLRDLYAATGATSRQARLVPRS